MAHGVEAESCTQVAEDVIEFFEGCGFCAVEGLESGLEGYCDPGRLGVVWQGF